MAESESNPKNELEKLTALLVKKQQESTQVIADIEGIKSRITDLTKITGEIDQRVTAYEKARVGLDEQRKKSDNFFKAKKKLLEDTLPNKQKIIDKKKEGYQAIEKINGELKTLDTKIDEKQTALNNAQKTWDTNKTEYANVLDLAGSRSKALRDLQDLEKQADEEGDKDNLGRMYFYILEMEEALKKAELPTKDEYRGLLDAAATKLDQASTAHRAAKSDFDGAVAERKAKQKELDESVAARRQKTAASIPEGRPAAEESSEGRPAADESSERRREAEESSEARR
jgi:hypothetical protein